MKIKDNKQYKGSLIIIFGLPGSGKSTQSVLLEEKLGYKYISWGRITRNILNGKFGSEDDKRIILDNIRNDSPYPDKYIKNNIVKVLIEEIKNGYNNFVVDGFP